MNDTVSRLDSVQIGSRIRELRTAHHMTQVRLAGMIHVSPPYLALIEHGKRVLSVELLACLSLLFHVTTDYILLGKDDIYENEEHKKWQTLIENRSAAEIFAAERMVKYFFEMDETKKKLFDQPS